MPSHTNRLYDATLYALNHRPNIVLAGAYSHAGTRAVFMPRAGCNLRLGLSTISQAHFAALSKLGA